MGPRTTVKASKPTYAIMVAEAIRGLADRTGSSVPAITKQLMALYKVDVNKTALNNALKKGVNSGDLVKIRASYKLNKKGVVKTKGPVKKKTAPAKTVKPVTKKSTTKKAPGPKKTIAKRPAKKASSTKKSTTKKAPPKKSTTTKKSGKRSSPRTRK